MTANHGLTCEGSEDIVSERSENRHFQRPHSHLTPHVKQTPTNMRTNFILLETEIPWATFSPLIVRGLSSFNFFRGGLRKTSLNGPSRSIQGHPRSLVLVPINFDPLRNSILLFGFQTTTCKVSSKLIENCDRNSQTDNQRDVTDETWRNSSRLCRSRPALG